MRALLTKFQVMVWALICLVLAMVVVRYFSGLFTGTSWRPILWVLLLLVVLASLVYFFKAGGRQGSFPIGTVLVIALLLLVVGSSYRQWRDYSVSGGGRATPNRVVVHTILIDLEWSEWVDVPLGYHLAFDRTELVAYEMETPSLPKPVLFPRELKNRVPIRESVEKVRFRVTDEEVPVVAVILRFWPIGTPHPDKVVPPAPELKKPAPDLPPVPPDTVPVIKAAPDLTVAGGSFHKVAPLGHLIRIRGKKAE
ncbi:MAG: hypothetical protein AAB641_00975 [Patescibacteria group bacterium]